MYPFIVIVQSSFFVLFTTIRYNISFTFDINFRYIKSFRFDNVFFVIVISFSQRILNLFCRYRFYPNQRIVMSQIPVLSTPTLYLFSLFSIFLLCSIMYTFQSRFPLSVDRDIFRFSSLSYFHEFVQEKINIRIFFSRPNRVLSYRVSNQCFFLIRSIFVIIYIHIYIYTWYQVANASMEWKYDSNRSQAILASAWRLRRKIDTNDSDTESSCRSSSSLQLSGAGRRGARGSGGRWHGIDALGKTSIRGKSLQILLR